MNAAAGDRVPIDAQSVDAPLSRSAVFLTVTVGQSPDDLEAVRDALLGIEDLIKTVGFRNLDAHLSCVVAIGSAAWSRLSPYRAPNELRPFVPVVGDKHTAPSTPGDVLFHIRAERADLCFEFERILLDGLRDHVAVVDEVSAFRYFDERDLLGFVDGTANPVGQDLAESALVGDSDPEWAGGSYVVTQKYLHDLSAWAALTTEQQEAIIGRSKIDNIERDGDTEVRPSHKTLNTITDDDGVEHDILRDNMPFGRPGQEEFGTFFIGYASELWVTERMLQRMFVGEPRGSYDRILDFSTAVTGGVFFAPSRAQLAALEDAGTAPADAPPTPHDSAGSPASTDGSLGIGSLRTGPDRATKGSAS